MLKAFPLLYKDLTEIEPCEYLRITQVTTFISPEIFAESLPDTCLLEYLSVAIERYSQEIARFLAIALKMFAEGFSLQRDAIFGFGQNKDDDTGTVSKISGLSQDEVTKMDES